MAAGCRTWGAWVWWPEVGRPSPWRSRAGSKWLFVCWQTWWLTSWMASGFRFCFVWFGLIWRSEWRVNAADLKLLAWCSLSSYWLSAKSHVNVELERCANIVLVSATGGNQVVNISFSCVLSSELHKGHAYLTLFFFILFEFIFLHKKAINILDTIQFSIIWHCKYDI